MRRIVILVVGALVLQEQLASGQFSQVAFRTAPGTAYSLTTSDATSSDAFLAIINGTTGVGPISSVTNKYEFPGSPITQFVGNCATPPPSNGGGFPGVGDAPPKPTPSSTVIVMGSANNDQVVSAITDPVIRNTVNSACTYSAAAKPAPSFSLLALLTVAATAAATQVLDTSSSGMSALKGLFSCGGHRPKEDPNAVVVEQSAAARA